MTPDNDPGNDLGTDTARVAVPRPSRIGIFRRVAVERYSGPLESTQPELLAPWRAVATAVMLALCSAALGVGLLVLAWS